MVNSVTVAGVEEVSKCDAGHPAASTSNSWRKSKNIIASVSLSSSTTKESPHHSPVNAFQVDDLWTGGTR